MPAQVVVDDVSRPRDTYRLIIASNRGPVEYQFGQDNKLKSRRGSGGMITALIAAADHMSMTWVAMAMTEGDRIAVKEARQNGGLLQLSRAGRKLNLRYVVISKPAYRKFYERISNRLLWFLQHYMYDPTQDSAAIRRMYAAGISSPALSPRLFIAAWLATIVLASRQSATHVTSLKGRAPCSTVPMSIFKRA